MNQIYLFLFCCLSGSYGTKITCDNATNELLTTVKDTCPEETTVISLTEQIPTVSNNFLNGMNNLKHLWLSNINLETIESDAFKNIPKCSVIFLPGNKIKIIKSETFSNLLEANLIDIGNNSISSLEVGAFTNLPNLKLLILGQNHLTEIKKGVFENITIQLLDLSQNGISKIEVGAFSGLIGPPVYKYITYIPKMELDIHDNKLEEINPEVFNIRELKILNLSQNQISSLHPGDLANLPKLEKLYLSNNKLKTISEGVFNGTKLTHLNLTGNEIATIADGAFDHMSELEEISLDYNKLREWNINWFKNSPTILNFSVSNNLIEYIPNKAFKNFPNCKNLNLGSNKIKAIASDAFRGTRLDRLVLQSNGLEELNVVLEEDTQLARVLEASGNQFKCSEVGKIRGLVKSAYLDEC